MNNERNYQITQKEYLSQAMVKLFPYTKAENVIGLGKETFSFSDLSKFPGKSYKYSKSDNTIIEKLEDSVTGLLFAKKTSSKGSDGSWTIITECESLGVRVVETLKKNPQGFWEGEIV